MFAQNLNNAHLHLKIDNRIAVACIQKMGVPEVLRCCNHLRGCGSSARIGNYFLLAEYLPGSLNTDANWQSNSFRDSCDWSLRVLVSKSMDRVL